MAITREPDKINKSTQEIWNLGFDTDFNLPVVENLVYNKSTGTMDREMVARDYEYMGKQVAGGYTYYGFKERGSTEWKIMRKDNDDASAWKHCYSEASANNWSTAWGAPASESYGNPPDS